MLYVVVAEELHTPLYLERPLLMQLVHSYVHVWALLPQLVLPRHPGMFYHVVHPHRDLGGFGLA